jgi:hypothetical protein
VANLVLAIFGEWEIEMVGAPPNWNGIGTGGMDRVDGPVMVRWRKRERSAQESVLMLEMVIILIFPLTDASKVEFWRKRSDTPPPCPLLISSYSRSLELIIENTVMYVSLV